MGCPRDLSPLLTRGDPVIAMQNQDEVCDSQHPCGGGRGEERGVGFTRALWQRQVEGSAPLHQLVTAVPGWGLPASLFPQAGPCPRLSPESPPQRSPFSLPGPSSPTKLCFLLSIEVQPRTPLATQGKEGLRPVCEPQGEQLRVSYSPPLRVPCPDQGPSKGLLTGPPLQSLPATRHDPHGHICYKDKAAGARGTR